MGAEVGVGWETSHRGGHWHTQLSGTDARSSDDYVVLIALVQPRGDHGVQVGVVVGCAGVIWEGSRAVVTSVGQLVAVRIGRGGRCAPGEAQGRPHPAGVVGLYQERRGGTDGGKGRAHDEGGEARLVCLGEGGLTALG